ncbi:MAG: hypothetical protein J1F40_08110, partial [Prevotellaceae bacterium]|nr:hypothetical protein [Prevotellaceae bacterium]
YNLSRLTIVIVNGREFQRCAVVKTDTFSVIRIEVKGRYLLCLLTCILHLECEWRKFSMCERSI